MSFITGLGHQFSTYQNIHQTESILVNATRVRSQFHCAQICVMEDECQGYNLIDVTEHITAEQATQRESKRAYYDCELLSQQYATPLDHGEYCDNAKLFYIKGF